MMIVNEKYKLNKEWLDLLLEHKNNANVTFNLSNNDIRILLTCIEVLQQENARLKDKIEKAINILNDPWSFESGNKEVDEITYQKKREVVELLKES